MSPAEGVAGARAQQGVDVHPRRLSHVFTSPGYRCAIAFYSGNVGLRLSDRSAEIVAFMHGIHGSDHHLLAFAKSPRPASTIAAGT